MILTVSHEPSVLPESMKMGLRPNPWLQEHGSDGFIKSGHRMFWIGFRILRISSGAIGVGPFGAGMVVIPQALLAGTSRSRIRAGNANTMISGDAS
jgi:hypothetical protein